MAMTLFGLDTTFLVEATVAEAHNHRWARKMLKREIASQENQIALAPQVLKEFVHVISDRRRFEKPLSMANALQQALLWWNAKEVRRVYPDETTTALFFQWMDEHKLGRKRILDTFLAATYRVAGATHIVSTNARDFAIFACFRVVEP